MLIPPCCFTCGKPIAHLWNKYKETLQNHKSFVELTEFSTIDDKKTLEYQTLEKLGIKRYCCKRMFIGNIDLCDDI